MLSPPPRSWLLVLAGLLLNGDLVWSAEKSTAEKPVVEKAPATLAVHEVFWTVLARTDALGSAPSPSASLQRALLAEMDALAKVVPLGRNYVQLLHASILSTSGDVAQARKVIQTACNGVVATDWEFSLARGDALRRAKSFVEAGDLFKRIGDQVSGTTKIRAAEGLGDVFRDTHDLEQARLFYVMALDAARVDAYERNVALIQRLSDKLRYIDSLRELMKHGLGFQLYASARRLQADSKSGPALAGYDVLLQKAKENQHADATQILQKFRDDPSCGVEVLQQLPIEPVYQEAAKLYRAQCLIELRRQQEAEAALTAFVREMPFGLYRGEAYLALGGIALDKGDIAGAKEQFTTAAAWPGQVAQLDFDLSTFRIPTQSAEITHPPERARTFDRYGNAVWATPGPEAVVNHLTTPWYMEDILREAFLQRGVCRFLLNEGDGAAEDLAASLSHDPLDQGLLARGSITNFARLRDGFRLGRFNATAEEIGLFKGRSIIPLIRAEVAFETEQWEEAITRYRALRQQQESTLSKSARAYLDYAEASALLYQNKMSEAEKVLAKFTGEGAPAIYGKDVISYPRALVAMANAKQRSDPIVWLQRAYNAAASVDMRADILLRMGQYQYVRLKPEEDAAAQRSFTALLKIVPATDYRYRAAEQYLAGLSQRSLIPSKGVIP